MKNEFEKLDQFMHRNRPDITSIPLKANPAHKRPAWLGYAIACGLSTIIALGVISNHHDKAESAILLSEVLSWDVTSDEFPVEMEAELAMLDF